MADAPEITVSMEAAAWRANEAFAAKLLLETQYEYTSKERLRNIAMIGLATLREVYANAAAVAEAQQMPERDALIVPSTEMPK